MKESPENIRGTAVIEETIEQARERYLKTFLDFRDSYSDELPDEIVHEGPYKCRMNFFGMVSGEIEFAIQEGIIDDPEAIKRGKAFAAYVTEDLRVLHLADPENHRTKPEDIRKADEILDYLIHFLERKLM